MKTIITLIFAALAIIGYLIIDRVGMTNETQATNLAIPIVMMNTLLYLKVLIITGNMPHREGWDYIAKGAKPILMAMILGIVYYFLFIEESEKFFGYAGIILIGLASIIISSITAIIARKISFFNDNNLQS